MRFLAILILFLGFISTASAVVSSSTNYQIEVDSINFSGGLSDSGSYSINTTAGEIATSNSSSTSYTIDAGYQAMLGSEITISLTSPSNVTMSPNISEGEQSDGEVSWTVTTNNSSGYSLSVRAGSSPAMTSSGGSLSDYSPTSGADFTWQVSSGASAFGFSPEGSHITQTYKDNGGACGTGSGDTVGACWNGFSTSNQTIASSNSQTAGTQTTLKLRAEISTGASVPEGSYSATLTTTALAL